ncbi:MAG: hypothetical protein AB1894_12325 [Chloroflexota bacterium]
MFKTKFKTALVISIIIATLAALASAGGLLFNGLYRDNAFVATTWLGNDAVTLFLAVPILVAALFFSVRGSLRAQLVWMGTLDYMLYNYAFYLFGAAFNAFFLVYAALLGLSIFALIFGLVNLDVERIHRQFSDRTPVKWISAYFLFVALGLGTIYLIQSMAFIVTGQLPAIVTIAEHPTNVVFALDLTLLIPWLVFGAAWLIKRRSWGYVIAGILSVKGPLYTLVLGVNSILVVKAGISQTSELPLWASLTVLGLAAGALLFGNMKSASMEQGQNDTTS